MKLKKCRDCGREIVIARGPSGTKMPYERVTPLYTIEWGVVDWEARSMKTELYEVHFGKCKQQRVADPTKEGMM